MEGSVGGLSVGLCLSCHTIHQLNVINMFSLIHFKDILNVIMQKVNVFSV